MGGDSKTKNVIRTVPVLGEAPECLPRHCHVLDRDIKVFLKLRTPPDIKRANSRSSSRIPSQPNRHGIRTEGEQGEGDKRESEAGDVEHGPLRGRGGRGRREKRA